MIIPEDPWSAISRGAALRVLQPRVGLRKVRRSYGISVHQKFIEGKDREEDSFECPIRGKRVGKQMYWHVKKVSSTVQFKGKGVLHY